MCRRIVRTGLLAPNSAQDGETSAAIAKPLHKDRHGHHHQAAEGEVCHGQQPEQGAGRELDAPRLTTAPRSQSFGSPQSCSPVSVLSQIGLIHVHAGGWMISGCIPASRRVLAAVPGQASMRSARAAKTATASQSVWVRKSATHLYDVRTVGIT